jgi:hypothetical protein
LAKLFEGCTPADIIKGERFVSADEANVAPGDAPGERMDP